MKPRRPFGQRVRRVILRTAVLVLVGLGAERALDWLCPYPLDLLHQLPQSTVVTDADGRWLWVSPTGLHERVLPCRWNDVSPHLCAAVLASEDAHFFGHSGVDFFAVARALLQDVASLRVVSGASTLTMQTARLVQPLPRTLWGKLTEAFRARQLERQLDKTAILDLWLTQVPMGGTLRGLESAARYWFGLPARELSLAQAATLVAMIPAPSARSPARHPDRLRAHRDALLTRMAKSGVITETAGAAARREPLGTEVHPWPFLAPHLCATVLRERDAAPLPAVLRTDADLDLHARLREVVAARSDLPGDGIAIVVLRRPDGALRAVIGSRDYRRQPLDAAAWPRSTGSTLKPFLYALARAQGCLPEGLPLTDAPLQIGSWRPNNFHGAFAGALRPADALASSANLPAIHCLERVRPEAFAELLTGLGLRVPASGITLDAALGTVAASPLQLARAYQRFADAPESVGLRADDVTWTLAALSRLPPAAGLGQAGAVAWKSGTSSGRRDAWCAGISRDAVVVVWLGNLEGKGEADLVGVRVAASLLAAVFGVL